MNSRVLVLGYCVASGPTSAVIDELFVSPPTHSPRAVYCINPHSYVVAKTDGAFRRALASSDVLLPDGVGITLAARLLRAGECRRITGSDLFLESCRVLAARGGSCFLLGSTTRTLEALRSKLAHDFPGLMISGSFSPPFKAEFGADDNDVMIGTINAAAPDVLWVAMTAPKQEKWIAANLPRLNVKIACAVGAVFDYYTGNVRRPGRVFQALGLEWLPRLLQDPRRLWRRMFVSGPVFMTDVLFALFQTKPRHARADE